MLNFVAGPRRLFPRVALTGMLRSGRRRTCPRSRSSGRSWCCSRLTAATSSSTPSPRIFHVELDQRVERPVNVVQVVVGPTGSVGASEQAVVDYIRFHLRQSSRSRTSSWRSPVPPRLFARKHRQQLFPDTPLLFAAVDQRYLARRTAGENETAVAVVNDFPRRHRRHAAGAAPDQAGVRGDGVRTDSAILAA